MRFVRRWSSLWCVNASSDNKRLPTAAWKHCESVSRACEGAFTFYGVKDGYPMKRESPFDPSMKARRITLSLPEAKPWKQVHSTPFVFVLFYFLYFINFINSWHALQIKNEITRANILNFCNAIISNKLHNEYLKLLAMPHCFPSTMWVYVSHLPVHYRNMQLSQIDLKHKNYSDLGLLNSARLPCYDWLCTRWLRTMQCYDLDCILYISTWRILIGQQSHWSCTVIGQQSHWSCTVLYCNLLRKAIDNHRILLSPRT